MCYYIMDSMKLQGFAFFLGGGGEEGQIGVISQARLFQCIKYDIKALYLSR